VVTYIQLIHVSHAYLLFETLIKIENKGEREHNLTLGNAMAFWSLLLFISLYVNFTNGEIEKIWFISPPQC
jgi:hypothetical protein